MLMLQRLIREQKGATAIEYGLIVAMIALACITGMQAIGSQSSTGWQGVLTKSKDAVGY
jgi:pilus assembly protein Flp/PilA